ncbi:MAG: hypothetical protein H6765_07755 [Candidatus Peribacteria bacterium]|nr:MAG: hypothetical protein H6765_07755 [Candidatus Peribacteria bacterium]
MRQERSQKASDKADELIQQEHVLTLGDQKFIVSIRGELDLATEVALSKNHGIINLHPGGDIYIYHPGQFPDAVKQIFPDSNSISKLIRNNILIIKKDDPNYQRQYLQLLSHLQNNHQYDMKTLLSRNIGEEYELFKKAYYDQTPQEKTQANNQIVKQKMPEFTMFFKKLDFDQAQIGQNYTGIISDRHPAEVRVNF